MPFAKVWANSAMALNPKWPPSAILEIMGANFFLNLHRRQIQWETNLRSQRSRNCSKWPN